MRMRVYAMARPRRPVAEREAVLAAAGEIGSAKCLAERLARAVAAKAMEFVDADPADRMIALLGGESDDPVRTLAHDPEIDTIGLILAERKKRLECLGGQWPSERQWAAENRRTLEAIAATLAQRYRRMIADAR